MMTTKNARDFLDKELFVKRSIVTFRSLSRELGIHVNDAKNELQHYYDAVRETDAPAVPTYLVSGEVPALMVRHRLETQQSDSAMDIDLEFEEDREEEMDVVHQSKVLLVDARTLDEAMSQFSRIHSVHIYSLSPSRFGDAGLVCTPSFKVHKADAKGGLGSFSVSGKISGSHVKLKAGVTYQRAASSSKTTLDIPAKATLRAVAPTRAGQQTTKGKTPSSETKEQISTTTTLPKTESKDRPKPSGILDWSKAKAKGKEPVAEKTRDEKKPKPEPDSTVTTKNPSANKNPKLRSMKPLVPRSESSGVVSSDAHKRGKKRKSHIGTDLESESDSSSAKAKPSNAAGSSVKQEEAYSDDDDDGKLRVLGQRRPKRKSAITSDSEMSLRAMMDIDDEQVDRVSRISKIHALRQEEEESEEEMNEPQKEATVPPATSEDEESDHVPIVTKKRKPRKVVHVGRNGLKKRRVIKSRMTTDAKGYMQTEDYSSYESVEEEEEAQTKPKGKGKETKKVSEPKVEEAKPKAVAKEESIAKLKAKAPKTRGGASKRGGLLNFFGPERGKK